MSGGGDWGWGGAGVWVGGRLRMMGAGVAAAHAAERRSIVRSTDLQGGEASLSLSLCSLSFSLSRLTRKAEKPPGFAASQGSPLKGVPSG